MRFFFGGGVRTSMCQLCSRGKKCNPGAWIYKVVQIWPGLICVYVCTNQSRSYLNNLVHVHFAVQYSFVSRRALFSLKVPRMRPLFFLIRVILYKVVQIWPGLFVCKQAGYSPGHILTTLYFTERGKPMCWDMGENYSYNTSKNILYFTENSILLLTKTNSLQLTALIYGNHKKYLNNLCRQNGDCVQWMRLVHAVNIAVLQTAKQCY